MIEKRKVGEQKVRKRERKKEEKRERERKEFCKRNIRYGPKNCYPRKLNEVFPRSSGCMAY